MIKEFSLSAWFLNPKDYNIITRNGNRAEILMDSITVDNGEQFVSARVYYDDKSCELIHCKSNGICIERSSGESHLFEVDLFMEIYKPLSEFESELSKLLYRTSLSRKDAVERAIEAAPGLIEIIKRELRNENKE